MQQVVKMELSVFGRAKPVLTVCGNKLESKTLPIISCETGTRDTDSDYRYSMNLPSICCQSAMTKDIAHATL